MSEATQMSRRQMLRGTAGAGAAAAGTQLPLGMRPIGEARGADTEYLWYGAGAVAVGAGAAASSPGLIAGGVILGLVGLAERAWDSLFGSDDSSSEKADAALLSADQQFSQTFDAYVNLFNYVEDTKEYVLDGLFIDAQVAALPKLQQQAPKSEIKSTAKDQAKNALANIQKSIINHVKNAMDIIEFIVKNAEDNGYPLKDVLRNPNNGLTNFTLNEQAESLTLVNGETVDVPTYDIETTGNTLTGLSLFTDAYLNWGKNDQNGVARAEVKTQNGEELLPGARTKYNLTPVELWNRTNSWWSTLETDIDTWVDAAVQANMDGDATPTDVVSPLAFSKTLAENQPGRRALGTLAQSGISGSLEMAADVRSDIDIDRFQGITIQDAILGITGELDVTEGMTITDPVGHPHTHMVGYEANDVAVKLSPSSYNAGSVDGGNWTVQWDQLTQDVVPWVSKDFVVQVETAAGETFTVGPGSESRYPEGISGSNLSNGEITLPVGNALTDQSVIVSSMTVYHDGPNPTSTRTIRNDYSITSIDGQIDGNEVEKLNFDEESKRIRPTDNFTTKEQWRDWQERQDEVMNSIEDDGGGGFFGGGALDSARSWIIAGIVGIFAVFALSAASG
jgi:hypothetical protein